MVLYNTIHFIGFATQGNTSLLGGVCKFQTLKGYKNKSRYITRAFHKYLNFTANLQSLEYT